MIDRDHLTEDEAARLWQRAAALQSEAAHRAEARSESVGEAGEGPDETDGSADSGYAIEHVRAAALEAGIGAEYLDAALVDLRAERALPETRTRGVFARRMLPGRPGAVTIKRTIEASPGEVLEAMERIFPGEPYHLLLSDQKGNVLEGGVLVFDIEGANAFAHEGFVGKVSSADLRQIYVSIHSVDEGRRCEMTLRGPVAWADARNAGFSAVVAAVTGGVGYGIAGGIGGGLAAGAAAAGAISIPVAGVLAAGAAIAGVLGGGGAGTLGLRGLYSHAWRQGEKALESLLSAVALSAQGGWGLGAEGAEPVSASEDVPQLSPTRPAKRDPRERP